MYDYLPRKDSELVAWSANFYNIVLSNAVEWGITPDEILRLETANTAFSTLHALVDSPAKTTILVAEKNTARKSLTTEIRSLAGFRLKNPAITDAQRVSLGLHVRDHTPTTIPTPTSRPELDIDVADVRRLKVLFRDMGSQHKAKPYGVNGAVIAYAVLPAPPVNVDALAHSVLATRTPHTLVFDEQERGKTVYVAICWQNQKGEKGPWSEIESAIVP